MNVTTHIAEGVEIGISQNEILFVIDKRSELNPQKLNLCVATVNSIDKIIRGLERLKKHL